jgi:hypothetical protein
MREREYRWRGLQDKQTYGPIRNEHLCMISIIAEVLSAIAHERFVSIDNEKNSFEREGNDDTIRICDEAKVPWAG